MTSVHEGGSTLGPTPVSAPDQLPRPIWFVIAFVVYMALALTTKSLVLNWIVGPLWLLLFLYVAPATARWIVRAFRRPASRGKDRPGP